MAVLVKTVFDRLVASSGVDPAGWQRYIVNAPGKLPVLLQ